MKDLEHEARELMEVTGRFYEAVIQLFVATLQSKSDISREMEDVEKMYIEVEDRLGALRTAQT